MDAGMHLHPHALTTTPIPQYHIIGSDEARYGTCMHGGTHVVLDHTALMPTAAYVLTTVAWV